MTFVNPGKARIGDELDSGVTEHHAPEPWPKGGPLAPVYGTL